MSTREVKELAEKYTPEQIEECIATQIETGENVCVHNEKTEAVINDLSKAAFIRGLVEGGMGLADALRELARRMREVQRFSGE